MSGPLNKDSRIENELPNLPKDAVLISSIDKYKDCKGYAIDIHGNAYSCKAHNFKPYCFEPEWRKVKIKTNKHGYPFIIMSNFGQDVTAKIHSIVARAFVPNPDNLNEVNHIDGVKTNNHYTNLEWCTHRHNIIHCIQNDLRNTAKGERIPNSILKETDVLDILTMNGTHKDIAAIYGIHPSIISRIKNGKAWKHLTANRKPKMLA